MSHPKGGTYLFWVVNGKLLLTGVPLKTLMEINN